MIVEVISSQSDEPAGIQEHSELEFMAVKIEAVRIQYSPSSKETSSRVLRRCDEKCFVILHCVYVSSLHRFPCSTQSDSAHGCNFFIFF